MKRQISRDRLVTIIICISVIIFGVFVKTAPVFYYYQGKSLLKNNNYAKARKSLRKAYFFNGHDKDIRYYYVQSLIKLKPDEDVQKEVFALATSNQEDSAQQAALNQVSEWRNNIITRIGDNYIEQAPYEKGIVRWDRKKFPLKINISDESGKTLPSYYQEEIINAFSQWQTSCKFLKFVTVNDSNSSDIQVKISPLPPDVCSGNVCKYVVGFTNPTIEGNLLKKMTITLYSTDPHGNFFSDKELYNTILHEIGHALGIMGHSYSSEDLMYMSTDNNNSFYAPYRSSFQYLSSKDINTLKLLYKMIPNITNTPLEEFKTRNLIYPPIILGTSKQINSRKLKEALNYIKKAPDLSGGYVDLAVAYAESNRNNDALKALNKALELSKTNDEKYIALYNIAVLNMNTGNLDIALQNAQLAKEISDSEEVQELISNIKHASKSKIKPFKTNLIKN